jgi:hypothetical protein
VSDREPFCCPHCRRPWDATEAAILRMQRIANAETTIEQDLAEPGFMSDLRLALEVIGPIPLRGSRRPATGG